MSAHDTYQEHAAIYSAVLLVLFRMTALSAPCLALSLSDTVYRRVVIYCAGLCFMGKKQTCFRIAKELGGCSHDALTRLMNSKQWSVSQLMIACIQSVFLFASGSPQTCWLILDDVLLPKASSKKILAAHWDRDYVNKKNIRCIRVVVLCWTNGIIKIPVSFLLWHKKGSVHLKTTGKKYRSKNDLARILVYLALRCGLPFDYLLFDSWYAGAKHLLWFHNHGILFITAIRSNRKVNLLHVPLSMKPKRIHKNTQVWNEKTVSDLAKEYPHSRDYHYYPGIRCRTRRWEVTMKGCPIFLSLVCIRNFVTNKAFKDVVKPIDKKEKDPNKYLLTNAHDLTVYWIVTWYRRRWAIEVLFRDCKQNLGLNAYQGQAVEGHEHHIACVFFSYVLMEQMKKYAAPTQEGANTLTIGNVKDWLKEQYIVTGTSSANMVQLIPTRLSKFSEEEIITLLKDEKFLSKIIAIDEKELQLLEFETQANSTIIRYNE